MEEIGMVYDTLMDVAKSVVDVSDTMDTIKTICDAVEVALAAASAIPGAAAVTGPVISLYESIKPALSTVIDLLSIIGDYLKMIIQLVQGIDAACQGKFQQLAGQGLTAFSSAA
jgi:phage-related protein